MKITVPDYYKEFKCTADKCKNNCCIGWEIDIDEATYEIYKRHNGSLKTRFEAGIATDGKTPHFVTDKAGRCAFLNENNLCDIFSRMGEESLCQICSDHPRFRNFYSGITETGLGLCCEAACELVLKSGKFDITVLEDDGKDEEILPEETDFFEVRQQIFDILEAGTFHLTEKFKEIMRMFGITLTPQFFENIGAMFENLEYMKTDISSHINSDCDRIDADLIHFEKEFKNLAVYFVFRHFADGLGDGMYVQRLMLAAVSVKAVEAMCKNHLQKTNTLTFGDVAEFARIYSAEIEYCDENIQKILERITEKLS